MLRFFYFLFVLFFQVCSVAFCQENINTLQKLDIHKVFQVDITSSINPATFEHLKKSFLRISKTPNSLLMIKMTTPGGLVSTTKEILNLFGQSDLPIIVWIAPEGSSATSAGAIIASGAHYLFMSEGTNIGAATPITINGDISKKTDRNDSSSVKKAEDSDMRSKTINDLVALVRSLSETRGRNATLYASMIDDAKSYTAKEAEEKNIIDKVANNLTDIFLYINTHSIKIKGREVAISIMPNVEVEKLEYSLADTIVNLFSSPEVAYILFLMGAALLYFELQAPGGFIAGSFGAISLVFASIGFHVLPVNYGAIVLLLISFVLFILEVYITSFGLLTLSGVLALTFGSLILFETPDSLISLDRSIIYITIFSILLIFGLLSYYLFTSRLKKEKIDFFAPIGHTGIIQEIYPNESSNYYMVKINGVMWKAMAEEILHIGQIIKVDSQQNNTLILNISKKI